MNCKPGDLAVVVKSAAGNEGKIVRCIRLLGRGVTVGPLGDTFADWIWEIDSQLPDWSGGMGRDIHDSALRPIRENDGEDESPQWAPVPQEVMA